MSDHLRHHQRSKRTAHDARATSRLILVRHTAVDTAFAGRCYGATDVALSDEGRRHAEVRAVELAALKPHRIVHSGMRRAAYLADLVSREVGVEAESDPRLAELNFGAFEGQSWSALRSKGHNIANYAAHPNTFCADGGETTLQMLTRVRAWYAELVRAPMGQGACNARRQPTPATSSSPRSDMPLTQAAEKSAAHSTAGHTILVVAHGGPIAALRGQLQGVPPLMWPTLILQYGEHVELPLG